MQKIVCVVDCCAVCVVFTMFVNVCSNLELMVRIIMWASNFSCIKRPYGATWILYDFAHFGSWHLYFFMHHPYQLLANHNHYEEIVFAALRCYGVLEDLS